MAYYKHGTILARGTSAHIWIEGLVDAVNFRTAGVVAGDQLVIHTGTQATPGAYTVVEVQDGPQPGCLLIVDRATGIVSGYRDVRYDVSAYRPQIECHLPASLQPRVVARGPDSQSPRITARLPDALDPRIVAEVEVE